MQDTKKIVFDLDGTLWQTRKSYVYAYQKLCALYNIDANHENVLKFMGIKLNILLDELFPNVVDKNTLADQAIKYSVEYLRNHSDDCCYDHVYEVIEKVSNDYEVYIVSNAYQEYVQCFLDISKTAKFIKGYYTIEQGNKCDHLQNISNNYQDKIVYVGDSNDDYLSIMNHKKITFVYAKYGYHLVDGYAYSIDSLLELINILKEYEKKNAMLKNMTYEVVSVGSSNLTIIYKENGLAYFGFVNFDGSYNDNKVLEKLDEVAISNGVKTIIGPINGNTWYNYRFALDNFDLIFYPDCCNSSRDVNLFFESGFEIRQKYVSTIANINHRMWDKAKKYSLKEGYKLKIVMGEEAYSYLDEIYDISIDAFAGADYYEEISRDDFKNMYLENIKLCNPDLILIFYHDELVAFNFCYEDLEKRYYVCKTTAIKKAYQNHLLMLKLVDASYQLMSDKGYTKALHHFQNDRTKTLHAIFKNNVIKQKYYGLLEKKY